MQRGWFETPNSWQQPQYTGTSTRLKQVVREVILSLEPMVFRRSGDDFRRDWPPGILGGRLGVGDGRPITQVHVHSFISPTRSTDQADDAHRDESMAEPTLSFC